VDDVDDMDDMTDFPLAGERTVDIDQVLDGLVLTHRLTDHERGSGQLQLEPDLDAVVWVERETEDGVVLPLAGRDDTARIDRATGRWLELPDGALPDAPAIAVRLTSAGLLLTGLDDLPEPDQHTADRLLRALELVRSLEDGVDPAQLVLEARARYPLLLSTPGAPLGQLLDLAEITDTDHGLSLPGEELDVDDLDPLDEDPEEDELVAHLRHDHGFDLGEISAILTVHNRLLGIANEVLRELIDRVPHADDDTVGQDVSDAVEGAVSVALAADPAGHDLALDALAEALAEPDLAAALLEDVLGDDAVVAAVLLAMLDHLAPQLRDRTARANTAWLRAHALELIAEDHTEAERELRRAVELGAHPSATFDLVRYLSDRGQAGAAMGYLRQLEGPGVEHWRELLAPYAVPGPTSAGRNDPCPCGSGRKHKVCCQARNGWPLQERLDWVWDKLMTYAMGPSGREVMASVLARLGRTADTLEPGDPLAANLALFEGGVIAEFCDRRGAFLPADELELLRRWADTRARLYEVVEVGRDDEVALLDLTSGERASFVDGAIAEACGPGDAALGWLIDEPDATVPAIGLVEVPDAWRVPLLQLLDDDGAELDDLVGFLRAGSAPPRMATRDGEPLLFVTRTYEVEDVEAAMAALGRRLEATDDATLTAFVEREDGRWSRGTVTAEDGRLVVSTMSASRADWFAELFDEVLPDARLVDEERLSPDDAMAARGGADDEDEDDGLLDLDGLDPDARADVLAQLDAFMARQEDAWVDTRLPALDGATPREAAADPTRRPTLLRLLEDFDDHAAAWTGPGRGMDADRLRGLLGLESPA
jgi:hypothetical protein